MLVESVLGYINNFPYSQHYTKEGVVIVVDDKNRENEGDLIVIATCTIPQVINFMIWYGRGLVCIVITS